MKSVLWDVDGTLSNSYMLGYLSTLKVLENNNIKAIDEETYHQGTKYTTVTRMAWHATGDPTDKIGIRLGSEFDDLCIKQVSTDSAPFYEGIHNLLNGLKNEHYGIEFGAVSNASGEYVKAVLTVNKVSDLFRVTVGADNVAVGKPSPLGLQHCSSFLGIHPSHCIYVGDSPTDGQAANAAGMVSVGVTWGSYSLENIKDHFTHVVHTVDELHTVLNELLAKMTA